MNPGYKKGLQFMREAQQLASQSAYFDRLDSASAQAFNLLSELSDYNEGAVKESFEKVFKGTGISADTEGKTLIEFRKALVHSVLQRLGAINGEDVVKEWNGVIVHAKTKNTNELFFKFISEKLDEMGMDKKADKHQDLDLSSLGLSEVETSLPDALEEPNPLQKPATTMVIDIKADREAFVQATEESAESESGEDLEKYENHPLIVEAKAIVVADIQEQMFGPGELTPKQKRQLDKFVEAFWDIEKEAEIKKYLEAGMLS